MYSFLIKQRMSSFEQHQLSNGIRIIQTKQQRCAHYLMINGL